MEIVRLFEDDDVIAVDKPDGIASIPERIPDQSDLLSRLTEQQGAPLWVVHRLDKEVSGVILFAKNAAMHRLLNDQFQEKQIDKTYIGIVHGCMAADHGVINKAIRACGSGRMAVDERRGKPSQTRYRVLAHTHRTSLLEVHPQTGRRHQIRVHLYSIGHPLVGDPRYGDKQLNRGFPRLYLHAQSIHFQNPHSGQEIQITSPLPDSFDRVCSPKEVR